MNVWVYLFGGTAAVFFVCYGVSYLIGWVYTLLLLIGVIGFLVYRMYNKYKNFKSNPVKGIPMPPLDDPILGHPEKMSHPYKHELRLSVCEQEPRPPIHQLVWMKFTSIFVNSGMEAAKLLKEHSYRGPLHNAFRLDPAVPDLYASDGDEYKMRSKALRPALTVLSLKESTRQSLHESLNRVLNQYAEDGKPLETVQLFSRLALDVICLEAFGYSLGALSETTDSIASHDGPLSPSEEGERVYRSLKTLADAQAQSGFYPKQGMVPVTKDGVDAAKTCWKDFVKKLCSVIKTDSETFLGKHGELDTANNFAHALVQLSRDNESFHDACMMGEIHQVLKHGYETIASELCWLFFALRQNPEVRADLEGAIIAEPENKCPEYLEATVKEVLRRYPVMGNAAIRTADRPDFPLVNGEYKVPLNSPIFIHIWSLQNTTREWDKPKDFLPSRWLDNQDKGKSSDGPKHPSCPFAASISDGLGFPYGGAGHTDGSLSFLPFSAGDRSCPGKLITVQTLRAVLYTVCSTFRLDAYEPFKLREEEVGMSVGAVITPYLDNSTTVRVRRPGAGLGIVDMPPKENGWADEDVDDGWASVEKEKEEENVDGVDTAEEIPETSSNKKDL